MTTSLSSPSRPAALESASARFGLRSLLPGLLGGIWILMLVAIGTGAYVFVSNSEQASWEERQSEAAGNAAQRISAFLERVDGSLRLVGALDPASLPAQQAALKFLNSHGGANPGAAEVLVLAQRLNDQQLAQLDSRLQQRSVAPPASARPRPP